MNAFLPDWIFAAFAIGGWELFHLFTTRLHWRWGNWAGDGIVVMCMAILVGRYIARWISRKKNPPVEDPEAWKKY